MRKSEMSEEQLERRRLFVETLAAAGWRPLPFNEQFDRGLKTSPEASFDYEGQRLTLRLDFRAEDPRVIFYLDSSEGRSLGLVFRCADRLKALLDSIVSMQNNIARDNIKEKSADLLKVCPQMFKISASGDKEIPVKSARAR